jgi:hypothetical protein
LSSSGPIDRRKFVRTAGGLFVAATVAGACRDAGSPGSGKVRVTINGLVSGTSGGTATITGSGLPAPLIVELPFATNGEATVAAGTYHVVYAPPTGYAIAPGTENELDVTVTEGLTSDIEFTVIQASGTLRITASGVSEAPDGGSAQVLRTDIAGQTAVTVNVPTSGTIDSSVLPGQYSVTYTAPAGYRVVPGTTNPRSVAVSATVTGIATFAAEPAPPQAGVVFSSAWSTAAGNTTNAKTDGGKWNIIADNSNGLEVVAGAPLGFPSPNCLRVICQQGTTGFHRLAKTGLGVVGAGESVWFRWYYRNEQPSLDDNSQHPIESGQTGGLDWAFNNEVQSNTTWYADFQSPGDSLTYRQRWRGPLLQSATLYRFEMQLHKLSATTWNLHVRVFNAANTQIAGDADYRNVFSSGGVSAGTVRLADNPVLTFSTNGGSQMDELRAGCNGIGGNDWFPSVLYSYQGCFAVSRSDWLGPYNPTTGV